MVDYITKEEFEFAKEDMQTLVDFSLVGETRGWIGWMDKLLGGWMD